MSEHEQAITDPIRIRALSHPLRLELLDVLADGPLTATECAELTGESVASCSFHLRMLAKYGFVEAAGRRGRERPWQLTFRDQRLEPVDGDPDSLLAVQGMGQLYLEHATQRVRRWLASLPGEANEWVMASTVFGVGTWATAEEMAEMSQALVEIGERFQGRDADPSLRPAGARPVRVFGALHVDVEKEERSARRPT